MSEYILRTNNLSKKYRNDFALKNINVTIKKGEIYGFIGQNGAGKSTMLRLVTGLTFPTSGTIELFGNDNPKQLTDVLKRMGAIIENPALFPNMSACENLEMHRLQRGIPGKDCINKTLDLIGLRDTGNKKAKNFSLGMKQRLGLGIALLSDPEFLILDEPTNGLDPMGIVELRELIKKLNGEKGLTVLISSHILSELHQLATSFGIIHKGKLLEQLSSKELDEKCRQHLRIKVDQPAMGATVEPTINMPNNDVFIIADQSAVTRVIENLISNAITHSEGDIIISLEEKDLTTRLIVKNDAHTLTESDVNRIFDRFYMADQSRSSKGTGLGLSIAKSLMDKMNGTIGSYLNDGQLSIVCEWRAAEFITKNKVF